MLRVRDILQQLPKNRKQRFKDVPLVDLLGREDKTDCLDIVTINNKYLIKMAAVFKWAGFAPIFPDTCYHLTHYWPAAADIPVASDNPVHYADAIRYNARTPLQGSLLPLTRLV